MKLIKDFAKIILLSCLLIANLYVPRVQAKTLGDLQKELEEYEKQYEENKDKKNLTQEQIDETNNKISSINGEITEIGDNIITLNKEIENLNEEIKKNQEEISSILEFSQAQNGESAYLEYAFGAANFTDFIYRIAVSEQLTSYNNKLVEQYKNNIKDNNQKASDLADKKIEFSNKQSSLKTEVAKLQTSMYKLDEEGLSIEELIKAKKTSIKQALDAGCNINEDIDDCMRGYLPADTAFWRPLQKGYIAGQLGLFGKRCSPTTGVCGTMHYGVDLSLSGANAGTTKVYAIASGVVKYIVSSYGTCGGKKIYIQHNINGKLYMSGYLHLNTIYVNEKQTVTKDTVIGIAAGYPDPTYGYSDECSKGGHLHLELSTGNFADKDNDYSTHRIDPRMYVNLPQDKYGNPLFYSYWYDRTKKF